MKSTTESGVQQVVALSKYQNPSTVADLRLIQKSKSRTEQHSFNPVHKPESQTLIQPL